MILKFYLSFSWKIISVFLGSFVLIMLLLLTIYKPKELNSLFIILSIIAGLYFLTFPFSFKIELDENQLTAKLFGIRNVKISFNNIYKIERIFIFVPIMSIQYYKNNKIVPFLILKLQNEQEMIKYLLDKNSNIKIDKSINKILTKKYNDIFDKYIDSSL